ncbi:MAG TPA: non-canonical purine NTP pyrophosphatase [Opitutaceae bacterium]|jgi:XTP/dITP diphosphohydrolase
MKLYLASGNPHKAVEFQVLADAVAPRVEIRSAAELGGMPPVVEDAGSFIGNAGKKLRTLKAVLPEGGWALADDSGLCVEELGGEPGVDSAYYAGPQADATANLAKLVATMRGVPEPRRRAEFVCVLALGGPGVDEIRFEGRCVGRLADAPRGTGGFGYDPLFIPDGFDVTLAQMSAAQKATLSHRGRAWARCAAWLAARSQTVLD